MAGNTASDVVRIHQDRGPHATFSSVSLGPVICDTPHITLKIELECQKEHLIDKIR